MELPKIQIRNGYLNYIDNGKAFNVLSDLNLSVAEGEFASIIGSSGCGKSTILSVLSGLRHLDKGEYLINNVEVNGPGKDRGMVFQHYSLFPWMTSKGNISFAIKQAQSGLSGREIDEVARYHLEKVGLTDFADRYPYQLSGGMQQRIAIARTLAMNPKILLMDEPFGAVDTKNKIVLQSLLMDILMNDKEQKTVVFVTHDVDEALLLSDKILFMHGKKIEEEMPVSLTRPRNRDEIIRTKEYRLLREKIMSYFFRDVLENIGGEEVVI
jgi:NitT/TauT family transport system ATP-binding protein